MRTVLGPPSLTIAGHHAPGGWWHETEEPGRIVCDLCPRACGLRPGDRGFCFVRENIAGEMVLTTYGKSTGFCIDPIEKKPLNHFFPGTSVLSFGTAGCNLGCKFCQNWSISKSREIEKLSEEASPETIAAAATALGCHSVAFTYNDPVVWAEYAIDAAKACRAAGIKTVAVTAGYITPEARGPFYEHMDAANVDLKSFSEDFYKHVTLSHLQPVLDTLRWIKHESNTWLEVTNLIIPDANDARDEVQQMCDWLLKELGPDVPIHFTAFHPDFKMRDRGHTRPETLLAAYDLARDAGLHFPYVGNVHSLKQQTTYCPGCKKSVIERVGYEIHGFALEAGRCLHCQTVIPGHFADEAGSWGSRRLPVRISDHVVPTSLPKTPLPALMQLGQSLEDTSTLRSLPMKSTDEAPPMTEDQQLLRFAAAELQAYVTRQPATNYAALPQSLAERPVLGTFVSLKRNGHLRSCCGSLGHLQPLARSLAHSAERTASDDPRFPPVSPSELPHLHLEIWLLANLQPVQVQAENRVSAIEIGRHGLQIARGAAKGLLLPGVAVDHGLSAEEFLRHVCKKAGLPPQAWKDSDTLLRTFEGTCFRGELAELGVQTTSSAPRSIQPEELPPLEQFVRENVIAALTGATPNYFAYGAADGNVTGIVISLVSRDGKSLGQSCQLNVRDSVPLQSALCQMAQQLGERLAAQRIPASLVQEARMQLLVLSDAAMHGTTTEPDLRGVDPTSRALLAMHRQRTSIAFDERSAPDALLARVVQAAELDADEPASLFSLAAVSSVPAIIWSQVPQPMAGSDVRPAAQAGRFYPAAPSELQALVDHCLAGPEVERQRVPAVMLPHAGLVYSGAIAGAVLRRVEIPERVIVIGPKHTPYGVDWAVAPQAIWAIPGAQLAADREFAALLVQNIPGLQLDAAAHAQEHAIEVELPFLARLAPQAKITGIALGQASLPQCHRIAAGLAKTIQSLSTPPLLIISSDMNHFATDAENRRLDEIALQALETLNPATLFQTVRDQEISMCGLIPAVIVLETLRLLGKLTRAERVAYATSADVSGDKSRVVGYAGMIIQ